MENAARSTPEKIDSRTNWISIHDFKKNNFFENIGSYQFSP